MRTVGIPREGECTEFVGSSGFVGKRLLDVPSCALCRSLAGDVLQESSCCFFNLIQDSSINSSVCRS